MTTLAEAVRRHADAHADDNGVAPTPIPGLTTVRAGAPSGLIYDISRPLVSLVVQGSKTVRMGRREFELSAGDSLLISADVPTLSQITRASAAKPYYSLVLELDLAVIADLVLEMKALEAPGEPPIRASPADAEVAAAAVRLMGLLDRPAALPVLRKPLVREMHYWLLAGQHGAAIRNLGWPDSRAQRVARAVAVLRAKYAQPLPVKRLAAIANMSPSSFHEHFRAVTSLSPRQFQKQLRLIEARRLMRAGGVAARSAAFAVGYESVSQFTREYGRLFGQPPARDVRSGLKRAAHARSPNLSTPQGSAG